MRCINHHHREVHVLDLCCFLQKDAYWWQETYSSFFREAEGSLLVAVQWARAVFGVYRVLLKAVSEPLLQGSWGVTPSGGVNFYTIQKVIQIDVFISSFSLESNRFDFMFG